MTGVLPMCLFGAGFGAFTVSNIRARDPGYRISGIALMTTALLLVATPARADQFREAADNAEVACRISSRDLTRISLVGDAFASVSKITSAVPGEDFTVTSEPVRGDLYLSVPNGWTAQGLSFFATSRKGYVYKFACAVEDVPAEQVFVTNPAIARIDAPGAASRSPGDKAVELIRAMASGALPRDVVVTRPAATARRIGKLEVRLVAEYRAGDLVGRQFRIDNHGSGASTLDVSILAPATALASSLETRDLAPHAATSLFTVLPAGADR